MGREVTQACMRISGVTTNAAQILRANIRLNRNPGNVQRTGRGAFAMANTGGASAGVALTRWQAEYRRALKRLLRSGMQLKMSLSTIVAHQHREASSSSIKHSNGRIRRRKFCRSISSSHQ